MALGLTALSTLAFTRFMEACTGASKTARSVVLLLLTLARKTLAGNGMSQMESGLRTLFGQITFNLTPKFSGTFSGNSRSQFYSFGLGGMTLL